MCATPAPSRPVPPPGPHAAALDPGLERLVALVSTSPELRGLLVSGTELKALNHRTHAVGHFYPERARTEP